MNQQLRAILMQDFNIKYIPRKKNIVVDTLSQYLKDDNQSPLDEIEDDLEDFIENIITNLDVARLGDQRNPYRYLHIEYS